MERQNIATRTSKYKNYRDDIKRNELYVKNAESENNVASRHIETGEPKAKEKKESYKPYKIYRSKRIRRGIFYSIFLLVLIAGITFGILMFARYLGLQLW